MAIVNRSRLRDVLVRRGIADESGAVEAVDAFVEEFENAQDELATRRDVEREAQRIVAEIKQYVAETTTASVNRIVFMTLGGIAVATAILGIVIAVT